MPRCGLLVLAVLSGSSSLSGCSSPDPLVAHCSSRVEEPLVNAANEERYLGLADVQIRAIVQVTNDPHPDAPLCSGAFVAPDWVVTAAHCAVIDSPYVVLGADEERVSVASVLESVPHPTLDVALLRVDTGGDVDFAPLRVAAAGGRTPEPGDVVELAGYGVTETGSTRELRFLAEPIENVEDDSVVVTGLGASGACHGDSGGPLLMRDSSGAVVIAGVLTSGSASCLERDRYVRLDATGDWFENVVGERSAEDAGCGGISEEGRCLYGAAVWCREGGLVADDCANGEHSCGWDPSRAGFRCVAPEGDPCDGVDSMGACRNGVAAWCIGGVLEREPCDCGQACRIDGRTGSPHCAPAAAE